MNKTSTELVIRFENVYVENCWKDSEISDLADFKAQEVDHVVEDIREDITKHIDEYLSIDYSQCTFKYDMYENNIIDDRVIGLKNLNIEVVCNEHYEHIGFRDTNIHCADLLDWDDHGLFNQDYVSSLDLCNDNYNEECSFIVNYNFSIDVIVSFNKIG